MGFYDVLDQIIDLLQRRGRVTYRALKREFNLDDEFIEDLKEELIDAQRVAIDEDGKILVWTGEVGETPEPASQSAQTTDQAQPIQAEPPPPTPPTPDAERRQLTVMFCDLADSTKLSGQLDPEDLRDVIRAYQQTCAEVIERFEGYIARYMGDGLLVYFGYPQAHEDDAQRAVRTGLDVLAALPALNARLPSRIGARQVHSLQVRIGIHAGLVVIETIGEGLSREHQALGETPNIAARLQGLAAPNTVVISAATHRLIRGYFTCDDLGLHTLKGVSTPVQVYQVVRESEARSRLDVATSRGLTPLVGREQEVGLLLEHWTQVKDGMGQVVGIVAEAGSGKSRLLYEFRQRLAQQQVTYLAGRFPVPPWRCH